MSERQRSQVGIGLMGLGVVGSGVARILTEKADVYARTVGCPLALRRVLVRDPAKERAFDVDAGRLTTDPRAILDDPEIDIVIEVMGGETPAFDYIREALTRGKFVVTANKEVMAKHGAELLTLARAHGVDILFEASVGGGIPIIAPLKRDLLANEILGLRAIINGTTNYILTAMSRKGQPFATALAEARDLGYAEPDATNDIEGFDAAYKLAILASLAFHTDIRPADVYREGISRLAPRDFTYAAQLGYAIKLLAIARRVDGAIEARVHPALIPLHEPLAKVDGVLNAVQVEGDLLGQVLFEGRGAGSLPTTSAVVADLLDAAISVVSGVREPSAWRHEAPARVLPIGEVVTRYYFRITVADRPGVLAQIARVLGDRQISIASVIQKEADERAQTAELVIMTHLAREDAVQDALRQLATLEVVPGIGSMIRVEGAVEE
ncbi:MAG TPA: homoserine dehydrogenase [Dehalococcoidia bacterium]|jgi:homoserine dehydrogenase|nr:homoserine dehydrogenase [Dehalococcoidia bacterium]